MTTSTALSIELYLFHQYRDVLRWVVPGPEIPLASLWDRPPQSASGGLDLDQYRDALDGSLVFEDSRWSYRRTDGRTRTDFSSIIIVQAA